MNDVVIARAAWVLYVQCKKDGMTFHAERWREAAKAHMRKARQLKREGKK